MSEIKGGDVVELRSGSPRMTVVRIMDATGTEAYNKDTHIFFAECMWYDSENKEWYKRDIRVDILKIADSVSIKE